MNKDIFGTALEVLGGLIETIGKLLAMKDEAAAKRALDRLKAHGRAVNADAIALETARGIQRPDPEDS
jgi:hypothetical protein